MDLSENYQFNYQKLLRFLKRKDHNGYMFVMADDYRFIAQINSSLKADLAELNISVSIIFLQSSKDEPIFGQIKLAADTSQSLIVSNLYEVINHSDSGLNQLLQLNFSREELRQLQTPVLFWVDAGSLNIIANQAPDLFSQRRFTTVHFTGKVENPVKEVFEKPDWKEFISTEKFKEIEAKIDTLKRRLTDAEESGYHPERIADEIAIPLAREYAELKFKDKAKLLLDKYLDYIDWNDSLQLRQLAKVYHQLPEYQQAIETMQKANRAIEKSFPQDESLPVYPAEWFINVLDITDWMQECGELNDALSLLKKTEALLSEALNTFGYEWGQDLLSLFSERIGTVFQNLGLLSAANEYYERSLAIRKKLLAKNPSSERLQLLLSTASSFLGESLEAMGNLQQAKDYFEQSLRLVQQIQTRKPGDEQVKKDIFICYNRLAGISLKLGNMEQAKNYYKQSLDIINDLVSNNPYNSELKRYQAVQYFQLGELEEKQNEDEDAVIYFNSAYTILESLVEGNPLSKVLQDNVAEAKEKIAAVQSKYKKL